MKVIALLCCAICLPAMAQTYKMQSPDGHIGLEINNAETLTYSVTQDGKMLVAPSPMGFQFRDEEDMAGNFEVKNDAAVRSGVETWTPVVRNRHAECAVPYNELALVLQEKSGTFRRMDLTFRVMDDGVAFRYSLYGTPVAGNRQVLKELTGFAVPQESSLWIPDFAYATDEFSGYKSSQEGVFKKTPVMEIASEIMRSLNPDCAIEDVSWIKPGMSAWDHWWSGEVKMEPDVIRQYIDLAAREGWPYMLIDWTWYGPYCEPDADITKPAPHLDMPGLIKYANVGSEYYKFSDKMTPEHNVNLAYTRLIAGQMDYTPGGPATLECWQDGKKAGILSF